MRFDFRNKLILLAGMVFFTAGVSAEILQVSSWYHTRTFGQPDVAISGNQHIKCQGPCSSLAALNGLRNLKNAVALKCRQNGGVEHSVTGSYLGYQNSSGNYLGLRATGLCKGYREPVNFLAITPTVAVGSENESLISSEAYYVSRMSEGNRVTMTRYLFLQCGSGVCESSKIAGTLNLFSLRARLECEAKGGQVSSSTPRVDESKRVIRGRVLTYLTLTSYSVCEGYQ